MARKGEAAIGCQPGLPPLNPALPPLRRWLRLLLHQLPPFEPAASPLAQSASFIAPENDEELLGIAKPARDKKKLIPSLTKTIIRRLCSDRFLTAEQLGNLIERRKDKLQENFLAAMVAVGELSLRFPDQVTHPDQAYRTMSQWKET